MWPGIFTGTCTTSTSTAAQGLTEEEGLVLNLGVRFLIQWDFLNTEVLYRIDVSLLINVA